MKPSNRPAIPKSGPLDCESECNLRVKRRDPWHGVNARPKTAADLVLNGQDAIENHRRVLAWFAGRWRNHQPKRAEKPHSIIQFRKELDGPATRPITPLAVENSVGKPVTACGA